MRELAERLAVVLVAPQGSRNIGSVCRVMKNFGFSDLRLVAPEADHLNAAARYMAVKSTEILEQATIFADLRAALADCCLALGTSRRLGRNRREFLLPEQAGELAAGLTAGRIALVLGREDSGLTSAELALCQRLVLIPTSEQLPSMNLAQAAGICLYVLSRALGGPRSVADSGPAAGEVASLAEQEAMYDHMRASLLAMGFLNPQNPDHIMRALRRLLGRRLLTSREINILHGIWSRIDWLLDEKRLPSQDRPPEQEGK